MKTITASLLIFTAVALSACMPSRGWQVNFGISPVSAIDNNQQFQSTDAVTPVKSKAIRY